VLDSYLLGVGLLSRFKGIPPWIQYSSIVTRHLLTWLSIVVLVESESKVVAIECTIPFDVPHGLGVPTSLWHL
jgi:hypothetical protein